MVDLCQGEAMLVIENESPPGEATSTEGTGSGCARVLLGSGLSS